MHNETITPADMHKITTVHAGASSAHRTLTACPRRHEAVDLAVCAECPHQRGFAGKHQMLCVTDRTEAVQPRSGTVGSIMARDVLCASPELDAEDVALLLVSRRVGCIPVVDQAERPIGIVSKTDLVRAYAGRRLAGSILDNLDVESATRPSPTRTARDLMSPIAVMFSEHEPIDHAAEAFAAMNVHHAPVVAPDGRLVGILTSLDLVRAFADDAAAATGERT